MDDTETKERIEETVRRILREQESNLDVVSESQIRKLASQQLGLDLSQRHFKALVKQLVQHFIQEKLQEQQLSHVKDYDDEGNLIICKLSDKRKVTVQNFQGKTLVSIREYYKKDGKDLPTSKGISLTEEQWSVFKKNVRGIEKAIKEMESRC
ncbi:hypothetical protein VNO78_10267 [Psophocarpus tetragonolobus]|uniref:DEK-C domain-containing protein n=1 Tax=Psophocarpus tetragonolobus TaxID=3891 RepID=A0AAN9SL05_PSOTE